MKEKGNRGSEHLTGLLSQKELREEVAEIVKTSGYCQYMMILWKIKDVGEYNEMNGHRAGDEKIKHFAQILNQGIAQSDIIARVGGTEFLALIRAIPTEQTLSRFKNFTDLAEAEIKLPVDVAFSNVEEKKSVAFENAYRQVAREIHQKESPEKDRLQKGKTVQIIKQKSIWK